jgi:hypothetical protein
LIHVAPLPPRVYPNVGSFTAADPAPPPPPPLPYEISEDAIDPLPEGK